MCRPMHVRHAAREGESGVWIADGLWVCVDPLCGDEAVPLVPVGGAGVGRAKISASRRAGPGNES